MKPELKQYFTEYAYGRAERTVFIFGGWRMRALAYRPLIKSLRDQGFQCVLYIPSTQLIAIGTPYSDIVRTATLLSHHIGDRIEREKAQGTKLFISFGISFGTIFATEAAKQCADIRKLILVAPFGDFAEHVRLWPRHRYFGKVLASQPTNQTESGEVLNQVGLTKHLSRLQGKSVFLCYAASDKVIHSEVTTGLIEALHQRNIHTEAIQVSGGHLAGICRAIINKKYLEFLG